MATVAADHPPQPPIYEVRNRLTGNVVELEINGKAIVRILEPDLSVRFRWEWVVADCEGRAIACNGPRQALARAHRWARSWAYRNLHVWHPEAIR